MHSLVSAPDLVDTLPGGGRSTKATPSDSTAAGAIAVHSNSTRADNDYLGEGDGKFFNAGGINSQGFERLASLPPVGGLRCNKLNASVIISKLHHLARIS